MDTIQLAALWEQIMRSLEQEMSSLTYNTWLKPMVPLSITENTFEIGTPKKFIKEWVESRYFSIIQNTVQNITKKPLTLVITNLDTEEQGEDVNEVPPTVETVEKKEEHFSVQPTTELSPSSQTVDTTKNTDNLKTPVKAEQTLASSVPSDEPLAVLNPKYVFETFVIGNANRFAHAASLAVAEAPAQVYNPFFIYGGVGLGKTHLMHAIGHRILKTHPNLKVLYISSEKFTNELINSIRDGNPESFRQKYRNIDVLLVDDIQFLSKKEHTQEEFFHTFNTLHEANKQIIISSDRPPREIQTLEDRLRSRFEWGLITDIQPPDLETRIAILRKKAMLENLNVPNDVMVFIASRIDNNIRELEGALIRVMAYASLTKQPIDIDLATEALKDIFPNGRPKEITMELIQEVVASYFKIRIEDLLAKKRTRNVAYPRQIAMYLCRELTETSLPRIGEMFGGRDHTTVIHAHDKINRERAEDIKLNNTIKELIKRIESA